MIIVTSVTRQIVISIKQKYTHSGYLCLFHLQRYAGCWRCPCKRWSMEIPTSFVLNVFPTDAITCDMINTYAIYYTHIHIFTEINYLKHYTLYISQHVIFSFTDNVMTAQFLITHLSWIARIILRQETSETCKIRLNNVHI